MYSNISIKPICEIADATAKTIKDKALINKIKMIKKNMIDAFSKERDIVIDMNYTSIDSRQAFFQDNDFYGINFRIHFNYPALQDLLEEGKYEDWGTKSCYSFSSNTTKMSPIQYTAVEMNNDNIESFSKREDPVTIIPYMIGNTRFLVVDGNHRVTAKKHNNLSIPCRLVNPLDSNRSFFSQTEKYCYELLHYYYM